MTAYTFTCTLVARFLFLFLSGAGRRGIYCIHVSVSYLFIETEFHESKLFKKSDYSHLRRPSINKRCVRSRKVKSHTNTLQTPHTRQESLYPPPVNSFNQHRISHSYLTANQEWAESSPASRQKDHGRRGPPINARRGKILTSKMQSRRRGILSNNGPDRASDRRRRTTRLPTKRATRIWGFIWW